MRLAIILGVTSLVMFVLAVIGTLVYGTGANYDTYIIPLVVTALALLSIAFAATSVILGVVSYLTANGAAS